MGFIFKRIGFEQIDDLTFVFNRARNTKVSSKYFKKKFVNPFGKFISIIAYYDNTPISHSGLIPIMTIISGVRTLGATSADTVTVVDFQRKGLFKSTMETALVAAQQEGVKIVFRLPNNTTFQGLIKYLDYDYQSHLYTFVLHQKVFFPIVKLLNKINVDILKNLYFKAFVFLYNRFKTYQFENSLISQGFDSVMHDSEYFKYKKFNSNYVVKIGKNLIWFKLGDGIVIGDICLNNSSTFIAELKRFCMYIGAHKVIFNLCPETKEYNLLSEIAMPVRGMPICFKVLDSKGLKKVNFRLTFADHDDF